jgi:hypothetical protein
VAALKKRLRPDHGMVTGFRPAKHPGISFPCRQSVACTTCPSLEGAATVVDSCEKRSLSAPIAILMYPCLPKKKQNNRLRKFSLNSSYRNAGYS